MKSSIVWRVAAVVSIALALGGQGLAQGSAQARLGGIIHHYTAALDADGPWHISGQWSVLVKGNSGKGDFSAALSMVRSDNPSRQAHTHHITITDGDVTVTGTGFEISGTATITGNGSPAGFTGSPVEVVITGGSTVRHSNIGVAFGGAAITHYGAEPVLGVVTSDR